MSRVVELLAGAVAGASVLTDATIDYNYPRPVDWSGITGLVFAVTALLGVILPFILVLLKRTNALAVDIKATHDLVNGLSEEKKAEKEAADLAKGEAIGQLKERANPMEPKKT